jgi:hypothetical protein
MVAVLESFQATEPALAWLQTLAHLRLARMAHAAVKLGLADALQGNARTVADLARATSTEARALRHFLRALCAAGLAAEPAPGRFKLAAAGALLVSGRDPSVAAALLDFFDPALVPMDGLIRTIRTGRPAFEEAHGMSFYDYLDRQAADGGARFDARMNVGAGLRARALSALVDFGRVQLAMDIGGGEGLLLAHLLSLHPSLRGRLLERPRTAARARMRLAEVGLAGRCEVLAGDFFEAIPPGADVLLLSFVLHNWDDARCTALLTQCRRSMGPHAVLYIVEQVRDPKPLASVMEFLDLPTLELLGGRERTREEFRALVNGAGLRLVGITQVPGNPFCVLEVRRSRGSAATVARPRRLAAGPRRDGVGRVPAPRAGALSTTRMPLGARRRTHR